LPPFELWLHSFQLLLGAWWLLAAAWRASPRLAPDAARSWAERLLTTIVLATWLAVASFAALGAFGVLRGWTLLACAFAAWLLTRRLAPTPPPPASWRRIRLHWPLLLPLAILAIDALFALPVAPNKLDALTYHLYYPLRWLQESRLFEIPAFADETVLYGPQNGALFFGWQMGLLGSDTTTSTCQVGLLLALMLALYRLGLLLGWRRRAVAMTVGLLPLLEPVRMWTLAAHVDVFMAAFFGIGCYWLAAYWARGDVRRLLLGGLALGLAAGSKTVALPLVAALLGPLVAFLIWRRRTLLIGPLALAVTLGGGFWWLAFLVLHGNPLFPVDLDLGLWHFEGIYDRSTVAAISPFHVPTFSAWVKNILDVDGTFQWLLGAVGWLGLIFGARRRPAIARALALCAAAAALSHFALVPHNNQTRFLLPGLTLGLLGLAAVFGRRQRRRPAGALAREPGLLAGLLAQILCLVLLAPWREWQTAVGYWQGADATALAAGGPLALLALGLVLAAVAWRRGCHRSALALGLAGLASGLMVAVSWEEAARRTSWLDSAFARRAPGFRLFLDPALPPQRIAYTGFGVPYILAGRHLRHQVVYCNVQGDPDDGLYQMWDRDRSRHREGLYREDADLETWLACLEQRDIGWVAVTEILPNIIERHPRWLYDESIYPIERRWMREDPARFERVIDHWGIEIYRRRREGPAPGPTPVTLPL
jgi:hypothetical protein